MNERIILVTGASGFIGRNVAKYFSGKGWKVIGIGLGDWGKGSFKSWGIDEWYELKITSDALKKLDETPDVIVHCAGSGSVAFSLANPKKDYEANVSSILPVLEFMKLKCRKARLIYPSSAAVYGGKKDKLIKETDSLDPVSPYGKNKKAAERLLKSESKKYGLNISIIRFFSVYGPGLRKQLFWDACEKIKNSDVKIEFFGTGNETRDWLYIRDAADLIYRLSDSKNKFEIINGGSGKRFTIKETVEMIVKEFGKKIAISFNGKDKKGDPGHYYADITKAKKLGWKPKIDLEEGLEGYVKFYKTNI